MSKQVFTNHPNKPDGTPGAILRAGDSVLFNYAPVKTDGTPGTEGSPVAVVANDPTLAALVPNPAVPNQSGSKCTLLKAGTVTVTVSSTNENGASYHTDFDIVIAPLTEGPLTDHFEVIESD